VLEGHGVQAVPPVEYVPALQSIQSALAVLPADDDLPAAQFIHAVPPVEYVPAEHCIHAVLPAGDDKPAAQEAQTLELVKMFDVAPARAYFPIGHDNDIHPVPPVEYVPAEHCIHAVFAILPAGDENPAAQEAQTLELVKVFDVAPARAYFPIGQIIVPVHVALVRPGVDPYFPAAHGVHAVVEPAVE